MYHAAQRLRFVQDSKKKEEQNVQLLCYVCKPRVQELKDRILQDKLITQRMTGNKVCFIAFTASCS